jgi:hypothetical protein
MAWCRPHPQTHDGVVTSPDFAALEIRASSARTGFCLTSVCVVVRDRI